jgi:flagellar protein FlgJ
MPAVQSATSQPAVPLPNAMGAPSRPNASPAEVGRQFESIFTSLLVKQLRQSVDSETMFGKDDGDVLGGMFDHFLGEHIAKAGSLGIGQMIRSQLERRAAAANATPQTTAAGQVSGSSQ